MKECENVSKYLPYIDFNLRSCIIKLYVVLQKIAMFFKTFIKGEKNYENVHRTTWAERLLKSKIRV